VKTRRKGENGGLFFPLLVILFYACIGVYLYRTHFLPAYRDIQKARLIVSRLQQEIKRYNAENRRLLRLIDALRKNDPTAWENATRKYLGWVKPGEIVIESESENE